MMHKKIIQNSLVFCLIAGVLVMGFFYLFEKDQIERFSPASKEVRKNPYLAAERFLALSGFSAESYADRDILINPPDPGQMIFVSRLGGNLPLDREDNLIAWMEQGGTLMVTHDKFWDDQRKKSGHAFLDRMGILMHRASDFKEEPDEGFEDDGVDTPDDGEDIEDYDEKISEEDKDKPTSPLSGKNFRFNPFKKEPVTVFFDDGITATIECIEDRVLEDVEGNALAVHKGESGSHIIVKAVGQGRLIVLSDSQWLQNKTIGEKDHAYVLGRIAAGHDKIWLLYTSTMPSFFMTMLSKAPFVMVSLIIFCLLFVIWLTRSIGPRYRLRDHSSRNIAEHLLAAGLLTIRHGTGQALIHGTRLALRKKIKNRYLFLNHKSQKEQEDYLAQWTGLSPEDIQDAFQKEVDNKDAFIKASATLQKVTRDVLVNHTPHNTEKT